MIRLKAASPDLGLPFMFLSKPTIVTFVSQWKAVLSQLLSMAKSEDSNRRGKLMLKRRLLLILPQTETPAKKQMRKEYRTSYWHFDKNRIFEFCPKAIRLVFINFFKEVILLIFNRTAID